MLSRGTFFEGVHAAFRKFAYHIATPSFHVFCRRAAGGRAVGSSSMVPPLRKKKPLDCRDSLQARMPV